MKFGVWICYNLTVYCVSMRENSDVEIVLPTRDPEAIEESITTTEPDIIDVDDVDEVHPPQNLIPKRYQSH